MSSNYTRPPGGAPEPFSFASPNRMLDNIKRMEEADLPSLPSILPNLDYDSGIETSQGSDGGMQSAAESEGVSSRLGSGFGDC